MSDKVLVTGPSLAPAAVAIAVISGVIALAGSRPAEAASPDPAAQSSVTMTVEPLLAGTYRAGEWVAVRVHLQNNGPAVTGELQLTSVGDSTTINLPVQLASGAYDCVMTATVGDEGRVVPSCDAMPAAMLERRDAAALDTSDGAIAQPTPACWAIRPDPVNCPWGEHSTMSLRGYTDTRHPAFLFECRTR